MASSDKIDYISDYKSEVLKWVNEQQVLIRSCQVKDSVHDDKFSINLELDI